MPYQQPTEAVVALFGSDGRRGLSTAEARTRLGVHGKNELAKDEPAPAWKKFLAQFGDVLVILLLVAAAISGTLWLVERKSALPYEAIAILAVVVLNALMGYIQESRAESALAALRQMAAAHANVIRDGARCRIPAAEIVPGDILIIEEGDTIAADARLLHSTALQTGEAALTGESLPVPKQTATLTGEAGIADQHNMVFSGTQATYGRGKAVVTATGMETEIGRISGMLKQAPQETTPLQKELAMLGKRLGVMVLAIAAVMVVTIMLIQHTRGLSAFLDVLILGVALAVAAVPESLPAVVTVVLAIGVQRMARRNAIVRRLAAVEALGSASVIASDKTGTLTKNEMTVRTVVTASGRAVFTGTGYEPRGEIRVEGGAALAGPLRVELHRALTVADRANNAVLQERNGRWTVQGDPTEGALLVAARKAGLESEKLDKRFGRIGEVPFSSERKLMSTIHTDADQRERVLVFTKGAPDVLVARCSQEFVGEESNPFRPLTDTRRAELRRVNEELTGQALRTLGVAVRILPANALEENGAEEQLEEHLVFLGLIGMMDPPREEAKVAVALAKGAGIRPIMITGDHPRTAAIIAGELGITADGRAITGAELDKMSDQALAQEVRQVSVYARVNPKHKLRIVKALQACGETVAMTGDGVNDAPALKTADIGIAMGITGTDVSKQAAAVVLTDDNFATIVAAVKEGRTIFANIRRFLRYLLASNMGEVMTMFFGVVLADMLGLRAGSNGVVLPLLATQLLWINLVGDSAPALALGVDRADPGVMLLPPRPRKEGVMTQRMWCGILFVGVITAIGTLLVLDACLPGGMIEGSGSLLYGQTMAFTTIVLFSLFTVFISRSESRSAFGGLFTNRWLWSAVLLSLLLQVAVVYVPFLQEGFSTVSLSLPDWLLCTVVASSVLWASEAAKLIIRWTAGRKSANICHDTPRTASHR